MKRKPRTYYTNAQKAVMWDRWQKGESLHSIAACLIVLTNRSDAFWPRLAGSARHRGSVPDCP